MRIGIDARELKKNRVGIGTYIYNIIKILNEEDKNNEYFLYSNDEIFVDFELNSRWHIKEYKTRIGTYFIYSKIPKILNNDNIDVFWGTEHCLPKRNKNTQNIKFLLTIHDLAIQKFKKIGSFYNELIQKVILKKSCENADKIIAISKSTKNDLMEIFNINENKIQVIYEGINNNKKYELNEIQEKTIQKKYNLLNSKFIFFLSTIEPRKNLPTTIKAFERYKDKNMDNLKFVISGGIGWRCKDVLELIKNSKYKKDIIQTGYITLEEKDYFFKYCDAFLYPSLYEGFGIPVLEAMQRGTLVITTNVSSLPEVGGEAAIYLQSPKDIDELTNIIEKVIKMDATDKKEYMEKGYEQVKKFSWKKCAQETRNLFEN